jgi:hypothetical protein
MGVNAQLIKRTALQIRRAARTEPDGLASFVLTDGCMELQAVAELDNRDCVCKYAELKNRNTWEVTNVLPLINNLLNN